MTWEDDILPARTWALALILSLPAAHTPGQAPPATDSDPLRGEWEVVDAEYRGKRPPPHLLKQIQCKMKNGQWAMTPLVIELGDVFSVAGDPDVLPYKLKPGAQFPAIDLMVNWGGTEHVMLGIFALHGDQLKICWQHDGKARPAEFKANAEPSQMLLVLKRLKR